MITYAKSQRRYHASQSWMPDHVPPRKLGHPIDRAAGNDVRNEDRSAHTASRSERELAEDRVRSAIAANDNSPLVLSRREAAALCHMSLTGFDSWVRKGIVPSAIPGTRRWSRVAIERAIAGDRSSPEPANDNLSPFEKWKRENANKA